MRRTLVALALASALVAPAAAAETSARIVWTTGFAAALAKAGASGRPLMVEFWAEWCGWCHVFERTTFADADVVHLARDFVAVRIDTEGTPDQVQVAERYGITGLPTILFLAPSGRTVLQVSGYQKPAQFARTLEAAKQQSAQVSGWERAIAARPDDADALLRLGMLALDTEAVDEARDLLARAYRADAKLSVTDRKHLRLVLGAIRSVEHKYAESEALLKEGLALRPADPENDAQTLLTLGRLYASSGKPAEASTALKRLVREHPQSLAAARGRQLLAYLAVRK
jgi:thioredoxin-related protein